MRIELSRLAANEIKAEVAYYNLQKQGLGLEFRVAIRQILKGLVAHPERWPLVGPKYRLAQESRFHFLIYYLPEQDVIRVARVVHANRDRGSIKELLP